MKDKVKLDVGEIAAAGGAAEYARKVNDYIARKNKLIRALMIAFSAAFSACLLFVIVGRGAELHVSAPAAFWAVTGALGAAAAALAVAVGVNMYKFNKFLKKFR